MSEVTKLIIAARDGEKDAIDKLFSAVYADLHRIAAGQNFLAHKDGLRTTSILHEAFFRLAKPESLLMNDREHFYAVAARAMRQLVVDHTRHHHAQKRGGANQNITLDEVLTDDKNAHRNAEILDLDKALNKLAHIDPHLSQLVEMRFFSGLDLAEIAHITGRSERTLKRDWRKARAYLHLQVSGEHMNLNDVSIAGNSHREKP